MDINTVHIKDTKMLHKPDFKTKQLDPSSSKWPERGFFKALDTLELDDQEADSKWFTKKFNDLGLFKNKHIEVLSDSDLVLTAGKSRKLQGKKLLLDLMTRKIERVQNKICSINFEIKFVEEKSSLKFAPKEWWLPHNKCLREPSSLDETEKVSFLEELKKADEHFSWYRNSLLDQLSHFKNQVSL